MRSTKILVALLVAAMFASCAKEEFSQENVIQNGEYVGAELLGSGISVNFGEGTDTKLVGTTWEQTDTVGLVWLTNGAPGTSQAEALNPSTSNMYSNHMFELGDNGNFTSKGNIYKGWYFGYYPFRYEDAPGNPKVVEVNPKQTLVGADLVGNDMLQLSARKFLEKKHLDENLQLNEDIVFDLVKAFHPIGITVVPSDYVKANSALQNLKIQKITLTVDDDFEDAAAPATHKIFTNKVTVEAKNLPLFQTVSATNKAYDKTNTKEAVIASLNNVLTVDQADWTNAISTKVENENITLADDQFLRIFVVPKTCDLENAHVKIVVEVENGKFTIAYTNKTTLTDAQKTNNQAIKDIVKAYATDGSLSAYTADSRSLQIELALNEADFDADYNSISTIDEWNKAVTIADAAKEKPVFYVDGDICITNEKDVTIPAKGLSVRTKDNGKICIENSAYEIKPALISALAPYIIGGTTYYNNVVVMKGAALSVPANYTLNANVTNRGNINVGYMATVKTVDNTDGRINVIYGSYVNVASGKEGIVAYNVTGTDKAKEINDLMTASAFIAINRIVVGEGKTFNLAMSDADAYVSGQATKLDAKVKDMTIELNGGIIKGHANNVDYRTVDVIEVVGGENTISNVDVTDELVVASGSVTVSDNYTSGSVSEMIMKNIVNGGTLVANADIYTESITTLRDAKTLVAPSVSIFYLNGHSQYGDVSGIVEPLPYEGTTLKTITKVKDNDAFASAISSNSITNIKLGANITIKNKGTNVNVAGKVIDGNGYSISTNNDLSNGAGVGVLKVSASNETTTIKNVIFDAPKTQYDVLFDKDAKNVVIEGCTFATATDEELELGKRAVYLPKDFNGTVTVKDCKFDDKVYAFNSSAAATAILNFENCELNGWLSGSGIHTFTNCTFGKSGDYQNYVPYTTANFIGCTFADEFAISLRHLPVGNAVKFDQNSRVNAVRISAPSQVKWDLSGQSYPDSAAGEASAQAISGVKTVYVQCTVDSATGSLTGGSSTSVTVTNGVKADDGTIVW